MPTLHNTKSPTPSNVGTAIAIPSVACGDVTAAPGQEGTTRQKGRLTR